MSTTHVVQFIEAIRTRTDVQTASLLATSLARWNRYYRFLDTILSRYTEVSLAYVAADEQWRQEALTEERFERDRDLQSRLHLEIESFYIFSKILLDRIADTFGYYFDYPLK